MVNASVRHLPLRGSAIFLCSPARAMSRPHVPAGLPDPSVALLDVPPLLPTSPPLRLGDGLRDALDPKLKNAA